MPGLRGGGNAGNPEYRELLSAHVARLQLDRYPNVVAIAPVMVGKEDEDFDYGVQAIVTGIRSRRPGALGRGA